MRSMQRRWLAVAALVTTAVSAAQWEAEPRAVMGVQLGVQLTDAGLVACSEAAYRVHAPCYEAGPRNLRVLGGIVPLRNLPELPFPYSAVAYLHLGQIVSVELSISQIDFLRAIDILTQRYGSPHRRLVLPAQSVLGVAVSRSVVGWMGARTGIVVDERAGSIDTASVSFTDLRLDDARKAARDQATKEAAGRL